MADEADDVLRVVVAVGVVGDAAAFVGGDLVLVDDPFEGGAVAEAVFEGFGRDAGEGEEVVEMSEVLSLLSRIFVDAPV